MPDYPDATLTAPLEALLLMATEPLTIKNIDDDISPLLTIGVRAA